jgi:hypothetical protein
MGQALMIDMRITTIVKGTSRRTPSNRALRLRTMVIAKTTETIQDECHKGGLGQRMSRQAGEHDSHR